MKDVYPCTIVSDRYSGSYSGALWTAWQEHVICVPDAIDDGDPECQSFWREFKGLVGKGSTPQEAYEDLRNKVNAA